MAGRLVYRYEDAAFRFWPVMVSHFLIDGLERRVFGEQATVATLVLLGLLIATGVVMAIYGIVATGRIDANSPPDQIAGGK